MKHTLGTAAKATGKSKTTIQRAIKAGKLSASKNDNNVYEIDPAELHRVFKPVTSNVTETPNSNDMERHATPKSNGGTPKKLVVTADLVKEMGRLRGELDAIKTASERERDLLTDQIEDLRTRLDTSETERRQKSEQVTMLLSAPQAKKGFFARLFGG